MAPSDLDTLVDMGFEKERAQLAVKHSGGLQGAIDWLEKNQDKSVQEIQDESNAAAASEDGPALQPGEEPKSLVCNECGKKFRSHAQAEFHASKTEHADFSESTEEVAPLTEEEKKARLNELRERMAAKRAEQSKIEKAEQKRNEQIRMKSTQEHQDMKEELQRQEQLKEAAKKKREMREEVAAKRRIKEKIAQDKEDRRIKAELERAQRTGQTLAPEQIEQSMPPSKPIPTLPSGGTTSKPASAYTEARLRLQTPQGSVQKNFGVETTLFEVAEALRMEQGLEVQTFETAFPRKKYDREDFGQTLKEAGMVPSASLIVK